MLVLRGDKQKCKTCGRVCSPNRTEQCFQCRRGIKKCSFPCCEETFVTSGDRKYCTNHRLIQDKEAYLARRFTQIGRSGLTETGFHVAMIAASLVF